MRSPLETHLRGDGRQTTWLTALALACLLLREYQKPSSFLETPRVPRLSELFKASYTQVICLSWLRKCLSPKSCYLIPSLVTKGWEVSSTVLQLSKRRWDLLKFLSL